MNRPDTRENGVYGTVEVKDGATEVYSTLPGLLTLPDGKYELRRVDSKPPKQREAK